MRCEVRPRRYGKPGCAHTREPMPGTSAGGVNVEQYHGQPSPHSPSPMSSARMQPLMPGALSPCTQSNMNCTPSRWCARRNLVKHGSTFTGGPVSPSSRGSHSTSGGMEGSTTVGAGGGADTTGAGGSAGGGVGSDAIAAVGENTTGAGDLKPPIGGNKDFFLTSPPRTLRFEGSLRAKPVGGTNLVVWIADTIRAGAFRKGSTAAGFTSTSPSNNCIRVSLTES